MTAPATGARQEGQRVRGGHQRPLVTLDHDTVTYDELGQLAYPGHDPQAMFTGHLQERRRPRAGMAPWSPASP